jgi:hypothetical protein
MKIISAIAIVGPVLAVLISIWVQSRIEKRRQKKYIIANLMSTRHQIVSDEIVRNLNMIDIVFHNKKKVRKLWHEYYDMLQNTGLNNPTGWKQWNTKKLELIQEMAKAAGFGKKITTIDVDRVYAPVGLSEDAQRMRDIGTELLRVLKESSGLRIVP